MPRSVHQLAITAAVVSGAFMLTVGITGCNKTQSADALLAEAQQYQQKGDTKAALIQLKNALTQNPDNTEARLRLGALYNEVGDAVSAEKEFRKALSLGASATAVLPGLAKALIDQGKFQNVLDETRAASASGDAGLSSIRGLAFLGLNQPANAKEAFELALKNKPGHLDATLGMARYSLSQKNLDDGTAFAEQAVAQHADSAEAWFFKAQLLKAKGEVAPALAAYDKVLALKPNHRSAHIEKAYVEIVNRKFDAAKADLDAARKTTPDNLMVVYTQALLDFTQGNFKAANDGLLKVLRVAPDHMPSVLLSGAVQLQLGSLVQAEQQLKKYLESNPRDAYARKLLATTLVKDNRPSEAVTVLAPLLKESPQDPQLLALAGDANLQARDFKKAAEYFEKASTLAPDMASLHGALGLSKLGQGDNDSGVRELERATSLDAKSETAGLALVRAQLGLKHYDKALAAAKALEKELPNSATVHDLKGGAYIGLKDLANARASFDKAVALQSDFFPAVINLAQLDVMDKKPADAKKRIEAFLEKNKKSILAMTALADLAGSQGHPEETTLWLERANSENPDAIAPAIRLGSHYLSVGEKQKALTLARKFQTANSTNAGLLELLAQAQLANDDKNGALETYSKLVNVTPKKAFPHFRMAQVHASMQNRAAAEKDLNDALAVQADFLPALVAKGDLAMQDGKPEQALAIARQLQKLGDRSPAGFSLEGDALLKQGKPGPAVQAYEHAFARSKSPLVLIKLSHALKGAGKQKEADARLAQWQKENPADVMVPMFIAEASMAKKQYKEAIEQYQSIIKRQPNNTGAMNNLAWAYQQEKDPRALETAEQALKLAPNSPATMDTLGWLLTERGDLARALPLLQKAVALAPNAPELRYHLAFGLNKSGDKANARKEIEKLLAENKPFAQIEEARALLKQL